MGPTQIERFKRQRNVKVEANVDGIPLGELLKEADKAFKELKNDLGLRPIYHQLEHRIEAHIFVAFMAYCLQVTLKQLLRSHAGGLTPPRVMEQMAGIQMLDVIAPTTTGQWLSMSRYTQPDKTQQLLLSLLGMNLPPQPPPKITRDMPVVPP